MEISSKVINTYTGKICRKFHATPEETTLLNNRIKKNFEYAIGGFDGSRDSRHLIREIKASNGIIPGLLNARPGLFWDKSGKTATIRENIVAFLKERNLPELADDLMGYGQEKSTGFLIVDDPAIKRFLTGLQEQLVKTDFRKNLAKLLQEY